MDSLFLPQSTSALDRWSDRAIRIVIWEFGFALALVIVASSYFPKYSEFENDHPPMTKPKLAIAVLAIFLPPASCVTSWQPSRRRVRVRKSFAGKHASTRVPTKPVTYSSFQILQLIAYSWVTAYDFVIFSTKRPWFWFSLIGGFIPALAGTIYGLVGIVRFFFAGSAQLTLHRYRSPGANEEYSDDAIENCALERAYQQQLPDNITDPELRVAAPVDGHRADGGDVLLSQLQRGETAYARPLNVQDLENNTTAQEPGASHAPARDDQIRPPHPVRPSTKPRFRWQEQTGARNGGSKFWSPMAATSSLILLWGLYFRWLVRNTYYSPQLIRLLALVAIAPMIISALSNAFLVSSLRRPRLALIFTAFCLSILASAVWFAEFLYSVWCFFYYMRQISFGINLTSFALVLASFGMTWCHVALLRCSVKMEWTPGYSSLEKEYKRWKERRGEAGANAEGAEDGDT